MQKVYLSLMAFDVEGLIIRSSASNRTLFNIKLRTLLSYVLVMVKKFSNSSGGTEKRRKMTTIWHNLTNIKFSF